MTEKPLRVGVVGVGYLGSIHAQIYQKMANVDLVAVKIRFERAVVLPDIPERSLPARDVPGREQQRHQ